MSSKGKKVIGVYLDFKYYDRLVQRAKLNRRSKSAEAALIIENYLNSDNEKKE